MFIATAPAEITKQLKSERVCVVGKILEAGRRACGKKVFPQIGGDIAEVTQRAHQVGPELDAVSAAGDRGVLLHLVYIAVDAAGPGFASQGEHVSDGRKGRRQCRRSCGSATRRRAGRKGYG